MIPAAFWAAVGLLLLRVDALASAQRRPAFFAAALAVVGIATVGVVWPVDRVDELLGDVNAVDLIQVIAATAAFWFLRDATRAHAGSAARSRLPFLVAVLAVETVTFVAIPDHVGEPTTYIHEHLQYPATWLHIVVYMVAMGWFALDSIRALTPGVRGADVLFVVGFALVVLAVVAELVDVTAVFVAGEQTTFSRTMLVVFNGLFYPGLVAISAAHGWRTVRRLAPVLRWRAVSVRLFLISARDRSAGRPALRLTGNAEVAAAQQYIELRDKIVAGRLEVTEDEERFLRRVDERLADGVSAWV
ncbi:hypothetical protein AABM26_05615 [Curtobacterium aetherium]|uniref:hypothetical protein n=1 Tax=Curtobacterium aetherium TaxID=2841594 RepID=UPI003B526AAD